MENSTSVRSEFKVSTISAEEQSQAAASHHSLGMEKESGEKGETIINRASALCQTLFVCIVYC